jgi:hypothetical protein
MRLSRVHRDFAVLLALVGAALACRDLAADEPQTCLAQSRTQDQLWLVSHRGLGGHAGQHVGNLKYWRYDREKGWVRSNLDELQAADDPNLATTIFVHGNRIPACEAFTKGWTAYRALVRSADERPVRFIVWSWPSEPVDGLVEDAREKARRTSASAYYLAWFVDRLNPETPVGLWGHSFGARIVTGALHLLGGGQLAGYRPIERSHASRQPMQVVLIVAALDNHWLLAGHAHGRALSQVDRMLLVNNSCDLALKHYHWIYHRRACQQALGYTGLSSHWVDGDARKKIEQLDACCQVGREHMLANYLCSPGLMARMRTGLLHQPAVTPRDADDTMAAASVGPALEQPGG